MAAKKYVSGAWEDISTASKYANGAWQNAESAKAYISGAWQEMLMPPDYGNITVNVSKSGWYKGKDNKITCRGNNIKAHICHIRDYRTNVEIVLKPPASGYWASGTPWGFTAQISCSDINTSEIPCAVYASTSLSAYTSAYTVFSNHSLTNGHYIISCNGLTMRNGNEDNYMRTIDKACIEIYILDTYSPQYEGKYIDIEIRGLYVRENNQEVPYGTNTIIIP